MTASTWQSVRSRRGDTLVPVSAGGMTSAVVPGGSVKMLLSRGGRTATWASSAAAGDPAGPAASAAALAGPAGVAREAAPGPLTWT